LLRRKKKVPVTGSCACAPPRVRRCSDCQSVRFFVGRAHPPAGAAKVRGSLLKWWRKKQDATRPLPGTNSGEKKPRRARRLAERRKPQDSARRNCDRAPGQGCETAYRGSRSPHRLTKAGAVASITTPRKPRAAGLSQERLGRQPRSSGKDNKFDQGRAVRKGDGIDCPSGENKKGTVHISYRSTRIATISCGGHVFDWANLVSAIRWQTGSRRGRWPAVCCTHDMPYCLFCWDLPNCGNLVTSPSIATAARCSRRMLRQTCPAPPNESVGYQRLAAGRWLWRNATFAPISLLRTFPGSTGRRHFFEFGRLCIAPSSFHLFAGRHNCDATRPGAVFFFCWAALYAGGGSGVVYASFKYHPDAWPLTASYGGLPELAG